MRATTTLMLLAVTMGPAAALAQATDPAPRRDAAETTVQNNAATRALDRAAGTNVSGAYPEQADGTARNPPGTAATRAIDRAAGTNMSGAYPQNADGTRNNPPGTAAERAVGAQAQNNTGGGNPGAGPQGTTGGTAGTLRGSEAQSGTANNSGRHNTTPNPNADNSALVPQDQHNQAPGPSSNSSTEGPSLEQRSVSPAERPDQTRR
ncbi:hypothetical protein [Pseudoroseomonas cervicalis]|uniref:hypothetical protein n=1 Tax=Teichococcus cervicalis TaxID=204525 RepID=UPI0022F1939E|nr:hypothetical protein [Pseudoroseomonas cervicalis]WBV42405.1 hypothetical protein PFY06_14325 [Pseudoroseomonas cervicalis]